MILDAVPYTCSVCRKVTMGKPHLVAITCQHCGRVDLGTEIARDRWRTAVEAHLALYCRNPKPSEKGSGAGVVVMALLAALALCGLAIWGVL